MKNTLLFFISALLLTGCALRDESAITNSLLSPSGDSILYEHEHFDIPGTTIRAIKVIDPQTVYFAGSKGKWGYTLDGGDSWHIDTIAQHEFRSIDVTPNQTIFLVSVQKPTVILRSTNNGKTFTPCLSLPDSMFIDQIHFRNNSNGVAIADPINGFFEIFTTHNGGFTWQTLKGENRPKALENEYPFAASNSILESRNKQIWFCTGGLNKARVHVSSNYGQTWFANNTPIISSGNMTGIFALHMSTDKIGLVAGGNWDSIPQQISNIAITEDGGQNWQELSPGNTLGYISDIDFIPDNKFNRIIAVQGTAKKEAQSAVYYSPDKGKTWKTYANPNQYITIRFANKNVAWLAGKNGIGRLEIAD